MMGNEEERLGVFENPPARYYPSNTLSLEQLSYWIAFSRVKGIGPVRFKCLLNFFQDDAMAAWKAKPQDLAQAGLEQKVMESFQQQRATMNPAHELERLRKQNIQVITWLDECYPPLLRKIEYAPPTLYIRGTLIPEDFTYSIGIVGTRKMSAYGKVVTEYFAKELVHGSMTIVSGLAIGVDTVAHTTALDNGGRTIAVLACGLDHIYPNRNKDLFNRIAESGQGALLTSFPLGVIPDAGNFPARNHLISGLSLGVLVTEAPERSGAMITANSALTQGREVYAVPGNIFANGSAGANKLIRDGAHPATNITDILEHFNIHNIPAPPERTIAQPHKPQAPTLWSFSTPRQPASEEEKILFALLSEEPRHIDELIRESALTTNQVSATLTIMQLDGMVKQVKNMCYARTIM